MKLERIALVTALALSAAACAADRNKEIKNAEATLTSEQQEARENQERLNQRQAEEQAAAQQKPMSTEERAELQTKQIEERAETTAEGEKGIADADKDVTGAHADMTNERSKVETDAKERLTKANAKAVEAKNKSAKVPANKRAKFNAEMNTFNTKKAEVQNRISNLSRSSNEEWKDAKAKLDKSLDDLEAAVDRLDDDM
ncbi:MAG: hypothetical protein KF850_19355 [Labilithrix sp.]|nr:hypothetical protein [Labilithrix sp.]